MRVDTIHHQQQIVMEYVSFQTEGDAVDFGDLTVAGYGVYGCI